MKKLLLISILFFACKKSHNNPAPLTQLQQDSITLQNIADSIGLVWDHPYIIHSFRGNNIIGFYNDTNIATVTFHKNGTITDSGLSSRLVYMKNYDTTYDTSLIDSVIYGHSNNYSGSILKYGIAIKIIYIKQPLYQYPDNYYTFLTTPFFASSGYGEDTVVIGNFLPCPLFKNSAPVLGFQWSTHINSPDATGGTLAY